MAIKKSTTKTRVKKKLKSKSMKSTKAAIIAQEIKFTRLLANNADKKVTDKNLKKLRKWLIARSESNYEFTENDFLRIWKGLFYCMWMSDKHLVQEETAEVLSNLVHCFKTKETMLLYTKSALTSLSTQWFGIDKYRMDKFDMLLRRIIRQTFAVFKNNSWDLSYIEGFTKILEELMMSRNASLGMILQIVEVYMEELAKVSGGNLPKSVVTELIRPFALYMVSKMDDREIKSVMKNIFRYLIFQSDVGLEYQEKFQAWRSAGFPCGSIKDVQKIELSDDDEEEEEEEDGDERMEGESSSLKDSTPVMDPRAGRVDVELPQLPFDAQEIIDLLTKYKFHKQSTTRGRKHLSKLLTEFEQLSKGEMPLGVKEVTVPVKRKSNVFSKRATARLLEFQSNLYSDKMMDTAEDEDTQPPNAKRAKKQQNKKRKLEDQEVVKVSPKKIKPNESKSPEAVLKKKKKKIRNKNTMAVVENGVGPAAKSVEHANKLGMTNGMDVPKDKPTSSNKNLDVSLKKKKKKMRSKNNVAAVENGLVTSVKSVEDTNKLGITNGMDKPTSCNKNSQSPTNKQLEKSLTPVVEKLDISNTNFIQEILRKTELVQQKAKKSQRRNSIKLNQSMFTTPTKSSDDSTKVINPMAKAKSCDAKKRVKIMLQKNTAQHTSEYLRQLKQSPAIPYDANRKPLISALKASPIPSPINPFYKRNSL